MKFLKWFAGIFIVYAIGDIGKMYFSHSMSAINKGMQSAVAAETPKLPAQDDLGLTTTRVTYNSPTLRRYITVPKGVDPEKLYSQKIIDKLCTDESLWMFEKGLRIENIFQIDPASTSSAFDMSMPDTTIVIDNKQCQHRGEAYVPAAAAIPMDKNTPTGFAPQAHTAYEQGNRAIKLTNLADNQ